MMLVNGAPADTIPATDRGLAYGDGVYRTLRAQNGEPMHWPRHFAKLVHDCNALQIPAPAEVPLLAEARTVALAYPHAVVKITVTRGDGPRGYAPPTPPTPPTPLRIVMSTALPRYPAAYKAGISAHLCQLRLSHQPLLACVKHLNRLENVLARAEWSDPAIAEGVLLDQEGMVIGGTMSNLCIVESGALIVPILSRCGVAGITLDRVLELAGGLGVDCCPAHIPLQRALDADAVFFVNSLIGLWPLVRLGERSWRVDEIALALRAALEAEDAAY